MSRAPTKVGMAPPHPGAFVREEILDELGLSVTEAARALDVRRATLSDLINGNAALSAEMALRIEKAFDMKMETLLNMQAWHDASAMRQREGEIDVKRYGARASMPKAAQRRDKNEGNMDEWTPVVALPNLDMRGTIECQYAALVPPTDSRAAKLRTVHPKLTTFLSKFSEQFGQQIWPSLLLLRADAPRAYYTAEAVTAFRDIISLSVVPYARALRLRFDRAHALAFTNIFQFYPWMLDKQYEEMISVNPAQMSFHLLEEFNGQSFPEQSQTSIMERNIDVPLAEELLSRWSVRFSNEDKADWKDKALFRSMNMANEAGRIPALTAAVFYDVGRSLALWVSAYEILTHPGGKGEASFATVSAILESVKWLNAKLSAPVHAIPGRNPQKKQLATWICKKVYDLRNDFLHGNDVEPSALMMNGKVIIDFAACLYRLALTGFLDLHFDRPEPPSEDAEALESFRNQRWRFNRFQITYEDALLTAV
jgi:addiction module HigA family antidote